MPAIRYEDCHRRRTCEPPALDVPAAIVQQLVSRGGERGCVRLLTTGNEGKGSARWYPQQLLKPFPANLLDYRLGGGG